MSSLLPSPIKALAHVCPRCKTGAALQAVSCARCNAPLGKVTISLALSTEIESLFEGLSQGALVIDEEHLLKHTFGNCPQWGDWLRWKTQVVLLSRASEGWIPTLMTQLKNVLTSFPHLEKEVNKYLSKLQDRKHEIDTRLRRLLGAPVHNPLEDAFLAYHLDFSSFTGKVIEGKVAGRDSSRLESNGALDRALAEVDRVNNALASHDALVEARAAFNDHLRDVSGSDKGFPADLARASLEWDALEQAFGTAVGPYPRDLIKTVTNNSTQGGVR